MIPTSIEPGAATWNFVMNAGRLCRCGHTEVCHWNGENLSGRESFEQSCAMCRGTCDEFRPTGARLRVAPLRMVAEDIEVAA